MGHSTEYTGTLMFRDELTASQIAAANKIFGEDTRDHAEWDKFRISGSYMYHIHLDFNDDYTGILWDGGEKTNDLEESINLFLNVMEDIGKPVTLLDGEIFAQGEEATDRSWIQMRDNVATIVEIIVTGRKVECPHCGSDFLIDMEEDDG